MRSLSIAVVLSLVSAHLGPAAGVAPALVGPVGAVEVVDGDTLMVGGHSFHHLY